MNMPDGAALGDNGHPVFQRDGFVCVYCGFDGNGGEGRLPNPLALNFRAFDTTGEQFLQFCAGNDDFRMELTAKQELLVMPPAHTDTGRQEHELGFQLGLWAREDGTGLTFSSQTGFRLPNGAVRAPDAAWVLRERYERWRERLRAEGNAGGFADIAPDFVIELRASSDTLASQQAKMVEYIENGVRLGWLIDPRQRRVYVYRPGQAVELLEDPASVSGEAALPGFVLNLQDIW